MNRTEVCLEYKANKPEWKCILFTDGTEDVWLPKSQIAVIRENGKKGPMEHLECVTVNLPEWLALKKGLI